jgi:PAS domain S-box-containing protein
MAIRFQSLRARVFGVLLTAVAPLVLSLGWETLRRQQERGTAAREELVAAARLTASRVAVAVEGARQALLTASQVPALRQWSPEACREVLRSVGGSPLLREMVVAGADGEVLCSQGVEEPLRMGRRLHLRLAAETTALTFGDYRLRDGVPLVASGFGVDAARHRPAGVVSLVLELRDWVEPAPGARALGPVWLVDAGGTIVSGVPEPERWTGVGGQEVPLVRALLAAAGPGTLRADGPDGVTRTFGVARVAPSGLDTGLRVAVAAGPDPGAFGGAWVAGAVALALVFVLGVAWFSDRLILEPVNQLVLAARRPGDEDAASFSGLSHRTDELGKLARAYEEMADSLERSDARLRDTLAVLAESLGFRLLVEGVKDYAIYMLDTAGRVISWNEGAERIKGFVPEEILGRHFSTFYLEEDGTAGRPQHDLEEALAHGRAETEGWRVRQDGSRFWASVVTTAIRDDDGLLRGYSQVTRDLTERRRAEETLRSLSQQLLMAQEEERRRIARELHDEIGQILTTVKISLQALQRMPGAQSWSHRLDGSVGHVDRAIREVRNLSLRLRPPMLDELGLPAALRWYAARRAHEARLEVDVDVEALLSRLPAEVEVGCFRVAQEALTNVVRHARAQSVYVRLALRDGGVQLVVRDDGVGFEQEIARTRAATGECMGLSGMHERVALLGGRIEMRSAAGKGTEIVVWFSLEARAAANGRSRHLAE